MPLPPQTSTIIIRLDDVQGLWGGQTLVVDADGNALVGKVAPSSNGLIEMLHYLKLSPDELQELLVFIESSGISEYQEHKRAGRPDEARPLITLTLPHLKTSAAKWAGDKDLHFDKLYARLLRLAEQASQTLPYRTQSYDPAGSDFP